MNRSIDAFIEWDAPCILHTKCIYKRCCKHHNHNYGITVINVIITKYLLQNDDMINHIVSEGTRKFHRQKDTNYDENNNMK